MIGSAALVTPNLQEAAALTECDTSTEEGTEAAACALVSELGAQASLVKGGHRDGPPRDLLAVRGGGSVSLRWLEGERVPGGPFHGTGCVLSAAIAAQLALGVSLEDAVDRGRQFVASALRKTAGSGARSRLLAYACTD
jgi:hydroxymethylpyrimidine/phosphomethylpyrimidine kinase